MGSTGKNSYITKIPKILSCICNHDFQDLTYGKTRRLMNNIKNKIVSELMYRCTICNRERNG